MKITHCLVFVAHSAFAVFHCLVTSHTVAFLLLIWSIAYLLCSMARPKPISCVVWMPDYRIFDLMLEKHNIPIIYYDRLQRFFSNKLAEDDEFLQLIDNDEQLQAFIMDVMECEAKRLAVYMQRLLSEA